jgi:hypothetical protein
MSTGLLIGIALGVLILVLTQLVVIPYIRLQAKRRESFEHVPQPEEIWVQDDGILYIDGVNQSGVELMTISITKDGTRNFQRWKDSWEDWHARIHSRTVFFTGQKRPLGGQ